MGEAPTLIRLTPVSAIARTFCRSTPPEVSRVTRPAARATAARKVLEGEIVQHDDVGPHSSASRS